MAPLILSVLYGSQWSISSPGRFTPGKEPRYPLHSRLRGYQIRSAAESIRRVKPKQKGLKLNGAYQVVVYAVNVDLVSDNTHVITRNQKLCNLLVRMFV
jgi:hypothetical protein